MATENLASQSLTRRRVPWWHVIVLCAAVVASLLVIVALARGGRARPEGASFGAGGILLFTAVGATIVGEQ